MKLKNNHYIKKPQSINRALLSSFILFALLLVVIVEVTCFMVVKTFEISQIKNVVNRIGNQVVQKFSDGEDINPIINDYRNNGIIIQILDVDGNVIIPEDSQFSINDFKEIKSKQTSDYIISKHDNKIIYLATISNSTDNLFVAVAYSMEIIKQGTGGMIWLFVLIGVITLCVAAIISYTVSHRLTDGLNSLSSTAVRFSKGDYEVNFANAEYSELADLSDTLNSVRDEVKSSGDFKKELLANVTHDLKTPLTMIKAYASMVKEISGDNKEKREKHLQVIIDEVDRLTGLVNDILSVSKVSSRLSEINFKVFNLTDFLYRIINKFNYLQETQGYKIMVDIEQNLYTHADEEKIEQVVYNLLGNAVNYTGEDKTVYITLKKNLSGDRINLKIRDTGKGIAKEDLSEIWNRYYRIKETHSRPVKGSGLGLNIVKIILENHSFDFGVQSEQGKGATFWIDFPQIPSELQLKSDNEN